MDIAKIRKKLKESEAKSQERKISAQPAKRPDDRNIPSDEITVEQAAGREAAAEHDQIEIKVELKQETEPGIKENIKGKEEKVETHGAPKKIEADKSEEIVEILTFSLLKEEFAFSVSDLEEILKYQRITRVPNVPNYILGITSLRGKVIPVVDLKLKLSLTGRPLDDTQKGKILIIRGPKGPIGVAVDKVIGVVRLPKSDILPPPSHLSETEVRFVEGIAVVDKRFVSIINMAETMTLSLK